MGKKLKFNQNQAASLLLRIGLAIVFSYAAISSLRTPLSWVGYLPSFLKTSTHATTLLKLFSIFELLLALWLLTGQYVKFAALIAAAALLGIVVSNTKLFSITFRDVAIIFSALALVALNWDN